MMSDDERKLSATYKTTIPSMNRTCKKKTRRSSRVHVSVSSSCLDSCVLSLRRLWRYPSLFVSEPPYHSPLKVTLPDSQSPVMTPALSAIHHVSCVSARCWTHWAVGGLSDMPALYNMQIITCKLPNRTCVCVCGIAGWMQIQQANRPVRVLANVSKTLQASSQIQLRLRVETLTASAVSELWKNVIGTNVHAHTHIVALSCTQPPAVRQQEMYCIQHSCNNKAGPVLGKAVLQESESRPRWTATIL